MSWLCKVSALFVFALSTKLRQSTGQLLCKVRMQQKKIMGPISFSYHKESLASSNLNSILLWFHSVKPIHIQKYSRLRCLLLVKGLVICFHFGWSGSTQPIRTNIIKAGSKSGLFICSCYTGTPLLRRFLLGWISN